MGPDLQCALDTLRAHEADLRRRGVAHAAVFGSVARGEARAESDIDLLVELDENRAMGIFEYARLKLYICELFNRPIDVLNRRTLKPLLKSGILHDAIHAF
jgi:predicted nucleotidyltransferase